MFLINLPITAFVSHAEAFCFRCADGETPYSIWRRLQLPRWLGNAHASPINTPIFVHTPIPEPKLGECRSTPESFAEQFRSSFTAWNDPSVTPPHTIRGKNHEVVKNLLNCFQFLIPFFPIHHLKYPRSFLKHFCVFRIGGAEPFTEQEGVRVPRWFFGSHSWIGP